jgi:hypothetical protein
MGLQIRTYVNGNQEFIELYGNENISMEVSFAEIQDIKKKNSAFTQEFRVPGTKNNNFIFNYFFDINTVALDWNPKRKFDADLIYDGYELYNGYVRMNSVTINKTEKVYSVTFYSAVGDLSSNIGDKGLCDVDTSSLNHSLYQYNTAETLWWDPSLQDMGATTQGFQNLYLNPVSAGDVQYILGQRGYDYTGNTFGTIRDINTRQSPILDFSGVTGFFDNVNTPVIPPYLIPSIRTRKLYELIVNQAGYQIESEFFDTDYFARYYIPLSFNTDSVFMAQSKDYKLETFNSSGNTLGGATTFLGEDTFSSGFSPRDFFKVGTIVEDNLNFNPVDFANYPYTPFGQTGPLGLDDVLDYVVAVPLSYSIVPTIEVTVNWSYTGYSDEYGTNVGDIYVAELIDAFGTPLKIQNYIVNITSIISYNGPDSGTAVITVVLPSIYSFNQTIFAMVSIKNAAPDLIINNVQVKNVGNLRTLPFTIELNKEMSCEYKQIEFIQNINKNFNLVVVEHPIKPKTLIIEPIVNYIGKGRVLDWTDKVDYNSPQTLTPTTSIINGSIFLSNKQDKDFINTQYNTKSNRIFGERTIDLGVDYKNQTTNLVQTLGQNTDYYLNASGSTNLAIPCYFISKESNNNGQAIFEYRPFRSLPRQVFKSVPLLSGNTGQRGYTLRLRDTTFDPSIVGNINYTGMRYINSMQNVNRLTTYPYLISGFSHYTIYNSSNVFTEDELVYPEADTQYDRYYRDYIDDLTSEENKIYNCKMYLKPWEVAGLYYNETIIVKNAKFRINKISNLSLIEPGLCDVELVKLTRDYTPIKTLYYDFVSCDNGCDIIHSNTDINYLLWAFGAPILDTTGTTEGKVVEIVKDYTGLGGVDQFKKYKVIQTEYNPDYTYERVFFEYGAGFYDNFGLTNYVMYDSCTATTLSSTFDIVNTLTGTTDCNCMTVQITNTGNNRSTFTFTNCDGELSSWTLDVGESITVCGCYGSFQGTNFEFCPVLSDVVCDETPLPTPTPTVTPFLSPTPTITPTTTPSLTPSQTATLPLTPTPSATRSLACKRLIEINITDSGWIKYTPCSTGITEYTYIYTAQSPLTIGVCIIDGTLLPGYPLADIASFTVINPGTPC